MIEGVSNSVVVLDSSSSVVMSEGTTPLSRNSCSITFTIQSFGSEDYRTLTFKAISSHTSEIANFTAKALTKFLKIPTTLITK